MLQKNFKGLFKQRIRWYRGYIQNVFKYSHMISNTKFGNLGVFLLPINFLWMIVIGFLFFALIITNGASLVSTWFDWSYINFAILPTNAFAELTTIGFYTYFAIVFGAIGLLNIWLSLKYSREKWNLKKNMVMYLGYVFIYPLLIGIFWTVSIFQEIFKVERKWLRAE